MAANISKYFVKPDSPVLVEVAEAVSKGRINSPEIKRNVKKMLSIAYGEQKDRSKGVLVGLAAPQIGISIRIILVLMLRLMGVVIVVRLEYISTPKLLGSRKSKPNGMRDVSLLIGFVALFLDQTKLKLRPTT